MTASPAPFDVCGPLPSGITLLEASAGTGKTFTIAALTARFVAAGTPLPRILLVTFGRMATGELRSRVRERLASAEHGLAVVAAGGAAPSDDEVLGLLASGSPNEVATRRRRLASAVADFDAATIATTHGFAHHVLRGIGVAGDVERDVSFVEDVSDLVEEVVDDLYLRRFSHELPPQALPLATARQIGAAAIDQPATPLVPVGGAEPLAAMRVRLAEAVRRDVDRRKRERRLLTYDDLLVRLEDALHDKTTAARLRDRFDVVMIDEFQDTDPLQWEIVRRAFGTGDTTLVLIGDPKQAIYAFRGADVHTYLAAGREATTVATLARNWRSDHDLVLAYDALFDGLALGHPEIHYREVRAADAHRAGRLRGAPFAAALRVRIADRGSGRLDLTQQDWATVASARDEVAHDVASDIVGLLAARAERITRNADGDEIDATVVAPGDIAVLVARHRDAALVRAALDAVGVPAVLAGAGSVFGTPVAREWLALLEALERPSSTTRVHAAALGAFFGWTVDEVATADDTAWEQVYVRLHDWAATLRLRGVAALLEQISRTEGLPARVLSRERGERTLTDLRHVGQLLHHEATTEQLGTSALVAWLAARIRDADTELADEERSRRLESDAAAVQVLTIHRCKGLEFPVVYCPFLWQPEWIPDDPLPVFHDPDDHERRTMDVGGSTGPDYRRHHELHVAEQRGEFLRLAYVALTRARHQTVVHWASSWDSRRSPLARILFARESSDATAELAIPPDEREVEARLAEIEAVAPGTISIEHTAGAGGVRWQGATDTSASLAIRPFGRGIDRSWRRASYSSLTASAKEQTVASEPDAPGTTDEDVDAVPVAATGPEPDGLVAEPLPLGDVPGGARTGTAVHAVLEHTDFTADDLDAELRRAIDEQLGSAATGYGGADRLTAGLRAAIETPLGPIGAERALRDIPRRDRLDELAFELPLAGGDTPTGVVPLRLVADLFDAHVASDEPLGPYGARLRDPLVDHVFRGYLTGSIDAVLRVPTDAGPGFVVVDYKTNWLAAPGTPLSVWHYRPAALADAMLHAHYPLQALLYSVALHRYLRWRVAGYDPAAHLAGVLYLFLRGMSGADTPVVDGHRCGVFSWKPPAALIVATSDLLDGGGRD